MEDYIFWHDKSIKELIRYFDSSWTMDLKLSYEEIETRCANRTLDG